MDVKEQNSYYDKKKSNWDNNEVKCEDGYGLKNSWIYVND